MSETSARKEDHIRICLEENVQARSVKTGLDDVCLIHRALPEASISDVSLAPELFNHKLSAPIVIEAMTGGPEKAARINAALAEAAEALGLAMGVGSQRVAIDDPKVANTFEIARRRAPTAFLIANLGLLQIREYDLKKIEMAIDMIEADALALHLNPLQEAIQSEGEPDFRGLLVKVRELTSSLSLPIIVKETGAGIASEEAQLLEEAGVSGIDVGGAGGTSWAAVEVFRAKTLGDKFRASLGEAFWDWGVPTVVSVVEVSESVDLQVIASGGLRSGIDIAKVISLGADAAGFAFPLLKPAVEGRVEESLEMLIQELKTAMFLIGAESIDELKSSPVVITGKSSEWLKARGFHPEKFARRERS